MTWTAADGKLLKDLRTAAGLDRGTLARRCTISTAQLVELEDGGSGRFYTDSIKAHTGRTVLAKLGYVQPRAPEPEAALPVEAPVAQATPEPAAAPQASEPPPDSSSAAPSGPATHEAAGGGALRMALPLLLAVAIGAGFIGYRRMTAPVPPAPAAPAASEAGAPPSEPAAAASEAVAPATAATSAPVAMPATAAAPARSPSAPGSSRAASSPGPAVPAAMPAAPAPAEPASS